MTVISLGAKSESTYALVGSFMKKQKTKLEKLMSVIKKCDQTKNNSFWSHDHASARFTKVQPPVVSIRLLQLAVKHNSLHIFPITQRL